MRYHLPPDPLGVPRNPLAVYLLVLALISGLGMMVGTPTAGTVERSVSPHIALAWGAVLFFGSAMTLVGMYWPRDARSGLLLKRTGMFAVGTAAVIYSIIVVVSLGLQGLLAAGTILGFGIACFTQFNAINQRIHAIIRESRSDRERP